ncbi:serine protease persephone-like [Contarinia nasturtii]|uniref:serine protease persephone-like n=1 Tax=Contarinia nasturtii TaxID=265458 RepID=UPI0012D4586D|nr:serine protease persephone-like [Contarinia nasturtii]
MGKTPLYVAISAAGLSCKIASNDGTNEDSGFGDAIELLIRNGAGVNIPNQDGWSPLHQAIEDGCEKIVEILLRHGANVNMKNKNNDTANDLANRNGNRKIIELLSTVHPMRPSENACLQYSTDRILTGELVPDDEKPWIFVFAKQHFENRILNGELAENNEFPWMAALVYFNEDYKVSFDCGGTIISNKFVLTAAHCVTSRRRPILVRIGKVSLRNGNNDVIKATNHHIEEIISNPRYNSLKKVNDISLIRVKNTIQFSIYIKPACLQTNLDDIPSHVKLTVTGWGTTSAERNVQSDTLLKTNLITMTLSECNSTMMEWNRVPNLPPYRNGLIEGQYCAHDPKGKNDSCYGDSGGPLQYFPNNKTSVATVVGIVSFGQSCGILLPSIYTRVAYYLDWIEGIVWPNV